VDRFSARTCRIDQLHELRRRLPKLSCYATSWYWHVPYVPYPSHEHLGKTTMHVSILSKYQLESATRTALPLLDEPWYVQLFNVRRCVLDATLRTTSGPAVHLLNTHLSAFSKGDGTLEKQVAVCIKLLRQLDETAPSCGGPSSWLLAGDFNALPPGQRKLLSESTKKNYPEPTSPLTPLFESPHMQSSIPLPTLVGKNAAEWFTCKDYGQPGPSRTIDHCFCSSDWSSVKGSVIQTPTWPSDHLPLLVELEPRKAL